MKAAVCTKIRNPLEIKEVETPKAGPGEVVIKVIACGVCHSDLHLIDGDWEDWGTPFPIIPGHEVVGTAEEIGHGVTGIKKGEMLGVPWLHNACGHCRYCIEGDPILCRKSVATGVDCSGGYAEYIKAPARFVARIPEGIDPVASAPLMCAGITMFTPLKQFGSLAGKKVAILGVGGLGHVGILFASALGAEVIAISRSDKKEGLAKSLGAHHYISLDREKIDEGLQRLGGADLILAPGIDSNEVSRGVGGLAPNGTLVVLAAVSEPLVIPPINIISGRKKIVGSPTGSPRDMREMLEVAAMHEIKPVVEIYPLDKVNEALGRLREGKVNLRAVLTPS